MKQETDILILGAGITGLSAAHTLHQQGRSFQVLEANDRVGGALFSENVEGFGLDNGANSFAITAELREWIRELGLEKEILEAQAASKNRYLYRDGDIHALAPNPVSLLKTRLLSLRGKLRMFREPFVKGASQKQVEGESIKDFFSRRIGAEAYTYLVEPVLTGIYAGDATQLRAASVMEQAVKWEQEHGSLLRGVIAQQKAQKASGNPGRQIVSFKGGLQVLAKKIAEPFYSQIQLSHKVVGIQPHAEKGWQVSTQKGGEIHLFYARKLVWTLPAVHADLLKDARPQWVEGLKSIPYPPMYMVHLGYEQKEVAHSLDGFGFLVPSIEQQPFLGAIWKSSVFPEKAPVGMALFTLFVGGAHQMGKTPEELDMLSEEARERFESLMGITAKPSFRQTFLWPKAIPQYTLETQPIRDEILSSELSKDGLFFAANWLNGVSVADCIKSGSEVGV